MRVRFKKTDPKAQTPTRGSREAAGHAQDKNIIKQHRGMK